MKQIKTLYFEGAGLSMADISEATIGNCRIRTAFHLDDGRAVYLEILGAERGNKEQRSAYRWKYTGFVDSCYYITDDKPNNDCNIHRVRVPGEDRFVEKTVSFEYTEQGLLKFVNSLGASFDSVKVVPDLGGYQVFAEKNSCEGLNGYYYGDEFTFDEELTARRQAVDRHYYAVEKAEGKRYPNYSLWVDEFDPGLLHLLRHFTGENRHWTIRVDGSADLEEILATAKEPKLGRYGC